MAWAARSFRGAIGACALCLSALPALAASDLSAEIGRDGLAATETRLAALSAPTPEDRFALAGLRFLRGVERSLQTRWAYGLNSAYTEIPMLRLPIQPNPAPQPFEPGIVAGIFDAVVTDMAGVNAAIADLGDADFGLEIALSDLWFDINANGRRDEREDLSEVAGLVLAGPGGPPAPLEVVVRFDKADAAWLDAYAYFLGAVGNVVMAYDPTAALTQARDTRDRLDTLNTGLSMANALDQQVGFYADRLFVIQQALLQTPDAARARAAHGQLLDMIARNRDFWALVAQETDNAAEWVPNDAQQSALGLTLPPGTGETWMAVLADAERVLKGEALIPYWRLGTGAGLNVARMFTEPAPVDILAWVQGAGAIPYAQTGPRITPENWWRFEQLVQGDTLLFAAFLN